MSRTAGSDLDGDGRVDVIAAHSDAPNAFYFGARP
jgi:hypothetical protein